MSCPRCDDTGQAITRYEPYEFTYNGRCISKQRTYVSPCTACERGHRIAEARIRKGLMADARREGSAA